MNSLSRRFGISTLTSYVVLGRALHADQILAVGNGDCVSILVAMPVQELGSAHRFLHERADLCLFGGSQLLQRE